MVAFEALRRNSCFAHPENIILSAVWDDDAVIQKKAGELIQSARARGVEEAVQNFKKHNINMKADNYFDLIDWNSMSPTVPPVLRHIEDVF